MSIDVYKIIKELGHGVFGTVYLVQKNGKKYALKIQKILKKDIDNKNSQIYNEIKFGTTIARKYPKQFMTLVDYDFIDNCSHKQKYSNAFRRNLGANPKLSKLIDQYSKSEYCVRLVYSIIDTTLKKIKPLLSLRERYSGLLQLLNIVYLLRKHKYTHNDFHNQNVGVIKTDKTAIIKTKFGNIPTFGYQYEAIDYGMITNQYKSQKEFLQKSDHDFRNVHDVIIDWNFWDKFIMKINLPLPYNKLLRQLKKTPEYDILKELCNNTDNNNDITMLYQLVYPDKFQKITLGKNYKKTILNKLYIPLTDYIYMTNHKNNIPLLIRYFMDKLKTL